MKFSIHHPTEGSLPLPITSNDSDSGHNHLSHCGGSQRCCCFQPKMVYVRKTSPATSSTALATPPPPKKERTRLAYQTLPVIIDATQFQSQKRCWCCESAIRRNNNSTTTKPTTNMAKVIGKDVQKKKRVRFGWVGDVGGKWWVSLIVCESQSLLLVMCRINMVSIENGN